MSSLQTIDLAFDEIATCSLRVKWVVNVVGEIAHPKCRNRNFPPSPKKIAGEHPNWASGFRAHTQNIAEMSPEP